MKIFAGWEMHQSGEAMSSLKRRYCWVEKLDGIWIVAVEKQQNSQKL